MIFEKNISSKTNISSTSKIKGELQSQEDIIIDGEITGKVTTTGKLEIKEMAQVRADLKAEDIIISGRIEGNIMSKSLDITQTGVVIGNIDVKTFSMTAGAVLVGECRIGKEKKSEMSHKNLLNTEELEIRNAD